MVEILQLWKKCLFSVKTHLMGTVFVFVSFSLVCLSHNINSTCSNREQYPFTCKISIGPIANTDSTAPSSQVLDLTQFNLCPL